MDEQLTVVGLQESTFKADNGSTISGTNVFCEYTSPRIEGYGVLRLFLTKEKLNGLKLQVGDAVRAIYNRYGKIARLEVIS